MGTIDAFAFSATHTYMYAWSTGVHNYGPRDATFLTYRAGLVSHVWYMIWLIGYGVMLRLRGATNSTAELFIVQIVQGAGSGVVQNIILLAAQITVRQAELAQITSLVLLCVYLGNGIGSAVAGAIYTGTFKEQLRDHLGANVPQSTIDTAFNFISDVLPDWGTPERNPINFAYSDVMRFMTIAALVAVIPPLLLVGLLPNLRLNDDENLASEVTETGKQKEEYREH